MFKVLWQDLTGHYRPVGEVKEGDCVLGDAFGFNRDHYGRWSPGVSNEEIALFIADHVYLRELPKLLRFELAEAYQRADPARKDTVFPLGEFGDNTYNIMELGVSGMLGLGCRRPVVVGHPHHVAREAAVVRKFGFDAIVPEGLEVIPWNPASAQKRTRGPLRWAVWEVPASAMFVAWRWM